MSQQKDSDLAEGVLTGQVPVEPSEVEPEHNHDVWCCREHGTHANPHRGCILR